MGEEDKMASTMSSVKDSRKKRIFSKKYFTEELKNAGALKIKTVNGVTQMALNKVSNMTVGLVVAAKGTKSFPDSVIVKWIKPGSKVNQMIERQFSMYDKLVQYLRVVHPEDVEKWKALLRTNKYVWPEENDDWSSIFGNETFSNFKIQPEKLLSNVTNLKEKDVTDNFDAKVLPMPDSSLENIINQSENIYKSHFDNDVSLELNNDKSTSKQSNYSDSDTGNWTIKSILVQQNDEVDTNLVDYHENAFSVNYVCKLGKENHMDHQTEYSNETIHDSICKNDSGDVSNLEKNIFRDARENSLQRLGIEYKDLIEPDDAKEKNVINITENYSNNSDQSLSICEDQEDLRKIEKDFNKSSFSDGKMESAKMQDENACTEENSVQIVSHQFQDDSSSQMDINDIDEEITTSQEELSTGNTESKEKASVPSSKSLTEIIIKNKRKKRAVKDCDINDVTFESYRVVILPEETQCSYCERITHTIDTCPDRKRIKSIQYNTSIRVKRYKKRRTKPKDLEIQNVNSTSSVLKCATGSKYLYKTKIEKATDMLNSSNNICFYANSHLKTDPLSSKPVKPFITNKWHKPLTNTISMKYDVEKKKKELLSKQIKELKELLNLFTNKKTNMTLQVKKTLLETIKSLQTSIDNIRQQLNNNVVSKTQSTNINSNNVAYKEDEEESSINVQNIENRLEKEKCEELKGVLSPSSRKKSEVCHSPKSLLSLKKLHDNSSVEDINSNTVTEQSQ